jgi:thymidylate kinase
MPQLALVLSNLFVVITLKQRRSRQAALKHAWSCAEVACDRFDMSQLCHNRYGVGLLLRWITR